MNDTKASGLADITRLKSYPVNLNASSVASIALDPKVGAPEVRRYGAPTVDMRGSCLDMMKCCNEARSAGYQKRKLGSWSYPAVFSLA